MKLTILGSGSFTTGPERSKSSHLLEIGKRKILVDAGDGTCNQLMKLGINPTDIDDIFITHFHSDHTLDIYSILVRIHIINQFSDKESKIRIYGPKGTNNFIKGLDKLYDLNILDENDFSAHDVLEKEAFKGFSVTPFAVEHSPSARAYLFEIEGKKIVFSGDSNKCQGIFDASKDADLLIIDCSASKEISEKAHLNTLDIAEICKKSNVKKAVLTHIRPTSYNKNLVVEVKEGFDGEVVLAEDFMEIEI